MRDAVVLSVCYPHFSEKRIPCTSKGAGIIPITPNLGVLNTRERKELSTILRKGSVIPSILSQQIKSMNDDLERTFLICNKKMHPLRGENSTVDSRAYIDNHLTDQLCKNDPDRIYFHTHSNFFSEPSLIDYEAFDHMFKLPGVKFACNTGTDGMFCISKDRRKITIPWGSKFDHRFLKKKKNRIEYGDTLFCNRENDIFDCTIQWRSYAKSIGKFKHLLMNSSTVALNDIGYDLGYYTHHPHELIKCLVTNTKNREVLMCQRIDEKEMIDGTPLHHDPACDQLDVCQMEGI